MIELPGDYWDEAKQYHALVCTTNHITKANGRLVMGAGIAHHFAIRFPEIQYVWGKRVEENKKRYGDQSNLLICTPYLTNDLNRQYLIAFPTKYHWKSKSNLKLIQASTISLLHLTDYLGFKSVLMTRPGCGHGGLSWEEEVKPILKRVLDDRFVVINKVKENE